MSVHVTRRSICRLCESPDLVIVLPLTPTPPADAYVAVDRLQETQEVFPLDVALCRACHHLQLLDVVDPAVLFRDYLYVTSSSLGLVEHFRTYAAQVLSVAAPSASRLAVDIGSNEGTLLRFFEQGGMSVLGVDAAENIASLATSNGIETIPAFFGSDLARRICAERGSARIVTANNVFAHTDTLVDMVRGVGQLLAPDGLFVFEAIYLVDMIEKWLFDTIYHEHLCFHSVGPLRSLFEREGLELVDVKRIPTKGGSIRGFVQRAGGPLAVAPSVGELIQLEAQLGLHDPDTYRRYNAALDNQRETVRAFVSDATASGKLVAGYGASATATTLLYHFGLGEHLGFIVDDNPARQNRYSPGWHIPIVASDAIRSRRPDYIVVLAWQYATPIIQQHAEYLASGGRFIVPLPEPRIIGPTADVVTSINRPKE